MIEIVKGMIFLWYGSIASIPAGYVLCNGGNSTPDLRDKFIMAAGASFTPGDQGGSSAHTHLFTGDGHTHGIPADGDIASGPNINNVTASSLPGGETDNGSSLPPYHALAYIMKT